MLVAQDEAILKKRADFLRVSFRSQTGHNGPMPPVLDPPAPPSPWHLFGTWLLLGAQSFGGGSATLALIRRTLVDEKAWIDDDAFSGAWALSQLAPGINLLALTVLLGRRLDGARGIAVCLLGLLLPSTLITLLLTGFYAHVRHSLIVKAALHGVVPASVGLGLLTAWQLVRPPLVAAHRRGRLALGLVLLLGSALAMALFRPPVVLILLGAALLGALSPGREPVQNDSERAL
jgi:chromate transporter